MEFWDKLEQVLINPEFGLKCRFENTKKKILQISSYGRKDEQYDHTFTEKSVKELIIYLKEPLNYKHEEYQYFSLVFIGELNTKKIWNAILGLNPTEKELIHLYKYAAFTCIFLMKEFIEALKTKESKIELIKLGYDGEDHPNHRRSGLHYSNLREVLYSLSWHDEGTKSEDFENAIEGYLRNSNNFSESIQEIIDVATLMIGNQYKSTELINKVLGQNIQVKELIESNVRKVEMHPFFIMSKACIPTDQIKNHLLNFEKHINKNLDLMLDIFYIKYYPSHNVGEDGYSTHNFIFESKSNTSDEIFEIFSLYQQNSKNIFKLNLDLNDWADFYKYLDKNSSSFSNLILERNLSKTVIKNNKQEKFAKI